MNSFILPKQAQTTGGILATGWRLGKSAYTKVLPFTLALAFLNMLLQITQLFTEVPGATTSSTSGLPSVSHEVTPAFSKIRELDIITIVTGFAILLLVYLITFIFHAALVSRMNAVATQKKETLAESLFIGFAKALPLLGVAILYTVITGIGFVLFVIPGIYIMIALSFSFYLIILKDTGVFGALKESYYLIKGQWWRTAFNLFVVTLIVLAIALLVGLMVGIGFALITLMSTAAAAPSKTLPLMIVVLSMFIAQIFILPIIYGFIMAIYYDLEVRYLSRESKVPLKSI